MTAKEVSKLIREFHVPLHVQRHCKAVADFAVDLGKKFIAAGEKIDLKLLKQAALLHDLLRVADFRTFHPEKFPDPVTAEDIAVWKRLREKYGHMHHAVAAAEILGKRGFTEMAEIIKKHRFLQIENEFNTWEEKILYYADKRVMHDKVVTLAERLRDGKTRNAPRLASEKQNPELNDKVFALEREIFKVLR